MQRWDVLQQDGVQRRIVYIEQLQQCQGDDVRPWKSGCNTGMCCNRMASEEFNCETRLQRCRGDDMKQLQQDGAEEKLTVFSAMSNVTSNKNA